MAEPYHVILFVSGFGWGLLAGFALTHVGFRHLAQWLRRRQNGCGKTG
jgi:hypothetical protein